MTLLYKINCNASKCINAVLCDPGTSLPPDWQDVILRSNSKQKSYHLCPKHRIPQYKTTLDRAEGEGRR